MLGPTYGTLDLHAGRLAGVTADPGQGPQKFVLFADFQVERKTARHRSSVCEGVMLVVVLFSGNLGRGGKPCRLAIIPDSSAAKLAGSLCGTTRNTELIGCEALILSVAPPVCP